MTRFRAQADVASRPMFDRGAYWYDLPTALIAQEGGQRGAARLLDLSGRGAVDRQFADIGLCLPANAIVVINDTRVLPARVAALSPGGGAVELFFLEATAEPTVWRCMVRAKRPVRAGEFVTVDGVRCVFEASRAADGTVLVRLPRDGVEFLQRHGTVPLPPYIERAAAAHDTERYQTVFATHDGAVAAPTAGLHFTEAHLTDLAGAGHTIARVTLHVGLGTFSPMRVDDVREHAMHAERYHIPDATAELIGSGRPVVAVGTTVVRALEAAALGPRRVRSGPGTTDIFFYPGGPRTFSIVDALITNFHLPESTLLMLVCAFGGTARILAAYRHAVAAGYRFFSYGDAMYLPRESAHSHAH